jgi:tetratricopeptide (TPR) repeat protein
MKNTSVKALGLAIAVLLVIPAVSMAQTMGSGMGSNENGRMSASPNQQGQTPPPDAKPATPAAAPVVNPEEEAAFKKLKAMPPTTDPKVLVQGYESFVSKYPKSGYLDTAYAMLAASYMQLEDPDKMFAYGNKALATNPNNVEALAVMTMATARTIDPGQKADAAAKEQKVETWGHQCLETLGKVTKPEYMTDADFSKTRDGKLAMCHSGLGLADLNEGKNGEAVKEFSAATKLEAQEGQAPDPVDLFLLGVALSNTKQYNDAMTAFQQCIKDTDQRMAPRCQEQLNETKKAAAAKQ